MFETRVIHLDAGQRREQAENRDTKTVVVRNLTLSFEQMFLSHYEAIKRLCASFAQPGVAVIAVDTSRNRIAGSLCLAAKVGELNAAIIGRHNVADLYLDDEPGMSLRHLALGVRQLDAMKRFSEIPEC